ncbi:hypothetical protein MIR68_009509 [Amoeboaphelidium protococcarum]|nr:hypothetical protein MIR68_009509 [Amoeboaphelidium protococcarum]
MSAQYTAVITGGSNGIGKEVVKKLLSLGNWTVVVLDIAHPDINNDRLKFIRCDITKDLATAVDQLIQQKYQVDVFINNAGIASSVKFHRADNNDNIQHSIKSIERLVDINFKAVVVGTYLASNVLMKGRSGGVIINVSSMSGVLPFALDPVYTGTKYGVVGLTKALQFSQQTVVALCPYFVKTNLVQGAMKLDQKFAALLESGRLVQVPIGDVIDAFIIAIYRGLKIEMPDNALNKNGNRRIPRIRKGDCILITKQGLLVVGAQDTFNLKAEIAAAQQPVKSSL